ADDVPGAGRDAADGVVVGAIADQDPLAQVRDRGVTVGAGANKVAGKDVAQGAGVGDGDAGARVARNQVAHPGQGAADRVVARPGIDDDAADVAHDAGGVGVDADVVAGDDDGSRADPGEP